MTRLKSLVLGVAAAALLAGGAASPSFAIEIGTFTNNLTGGSIGLPPAPPPPGVSALEFVGAPGGQNGNNVGNQGPTITG